MGGWGAAGLLAVALVAGAVGCDGNGPEDERVEDPGTVPPDTRPGTPDVGAVPDAGPGPVDGGATSDAGTGGGGGSTDGGTPDSGTGGGGRTDAGTPDSGTGGGASDGGAPDSGTGGGGGAIDGGAADGGTGDGGGAIDGGAPDSGTGDGGAASTSFERVIGADGADVGNAVAIARDGDVLVASSHSLLLPDFGEGPQPERGNAVLSRFTPNGQHLWTYAEVFVRSCTNGSPCGLSNIRATAVAVDAAGRAALGTVTYEEGADFGEFGLRQVPRITLLDREGKVLWTRPIPGPAGAAALSGLGFDAAGNVYASGSIQGPGWDFGDGQPRGTELLPAIYVASYSPEGALRWVKLFGDARGSSRQAVMAMDSAGGFVLMGELTGRLSFGGEELVGNEDGALPTPDRYVEPRDFVARFGPEGAHRWSRLLAPGTAEVSDLSVGPGGVALAGWFSNSFTFAGRTLRPRLDDDGNGQDGFVAVMGPEGQERWVVSVESARADGMYGVGWAPGGDVWAAGDAGKGARVGATPVPPAPGPGGSFVLTRLRGGTGEVVSVASSRGGTPHEGDLDVDARGVIAVTGSVPGGTTCDEGCGGALELFLMQRVP